MLLSTFFDSSLGEFMKGSIVVETLPGLLEYASMELKRIFGRDSEPFLNSDNMLIFETNNVTYDSVLLTLFSETTRKFYMLLGSWELKDESDLYSGPLNVNWDALLHEDLSFAVRPLVKDNELIKLIGKQVGQAIIDSYYKSKGKRLRVNLSEPDIEIYAWIRNSNLVLGLNLSGDELNDEKTILARSTLLASNWNAESSFSEIIYAGISTSALRFATNEALRSRLRYVSFINLPFVDKNLILELARKNWRINREVNVRCYEVKGRINLIKQVNPELRKIALYDIEELAECNSIFLASNLITSLEKKNEQLLWAKKIADILNRNASWKYFTILARDDVVSQINLNAIKDEKSIIFKEIRAKMVRYIR